MSGLLAIHHPRNNKRNLPLMKIRNQPLMKIRNIVKKLILMSMRKYIRMKNPVKTRRPLLKKIKKEEPQKQSTGTVAKQTKKEEKESNDDDIKVSLGKNFVKSDYLVLIKYYYL
jgi:hypothetical protein